MPRHIPAEDFDKAIDLAMKTSVNNAARKFGISTTAIRRRMVALGIPRRRCGNFTLKELDVFGRYLVQ